MRLAMVVGHPVGGDVPAAVVAGGSLVVTAVAIERAAAEELFQAGAVFRGQVAGVPRQGQLIAAAVTLAGVMLANQRRKVVVEGTRHHAGPLAKGAVNRQLGG